MNTDKIGNTKKKKLFAEWAQSIAIYSLLFIVVTYGIDYWRSRTMPSGQMLGLVVNDVQGNKVDLLALSAKQPVIIYFWATWCNICSTVSPSVDWIADYYPVLTVALSSGDNIRIKQYLHSKNYGFSTINDQQGVISKAWGVSVTPTIFIVDKGEIKSVTTGFTSPIGMWFRLLLA